MQTLMGSPSGRIAAGDRSLAMRGLGTISDTFHTP